MDSVIRAIVIYLVLLVIFRVSGKRSLAQMTTFDLVLTLIISEAIQQALVDTDNSLTHAILLVVTLVGFDILLSFVKQRWPGLERVIEGAPVLIMERGRLLRERMARERVDEDDILVAARHQHGLSRLDQIRYAVVETSGGISVIPEREAR